MSLHFEQLTVSDIRRETNDCVSIAFQIPESVKEKFTFIQGQYITLRTHINGEEIRRSYSICSSPLDGELRVAVKEVPGGLFSTYANRELKVGQMLDVMPPMGKFYTRLDPAQSNRYVAFAAGSGITPILSIIKTTLLTEPESHFTLVYGNRNRHSIIFRETLEALKNKFMNRLSIIYLLSQERTDTAIHSGRIDQEKCTELLQKPIQANQVKAFFLCGPEEMIFSVKDLLLQKGVAEENIHFELFTTSKQQQRANHSRPTEEATGPVSDITVTLDGISFDFRLPQNGEAILDAALRNGADLPYACKGGVCCTCRAKLIEGEVSMDVNYGLEPEEIQQGFILTCQSHPKSSKVVVDFDAK
jgi:ring-1,2-phenylacetyl-CoA epoxidase subunit PaaE